MDHQTRIDTAYRNLVNATERLRIAVANLRPHDLASIQALADAKTAWDDAVAKFREVAGLILILTTASVLVVQLAA